MNLIIVCLKFESSQWSMINGCDFNSDVIHKLPFKNLTVSHAQLNVQVVMVTKQQISSHMVGELTYVSKREGRVLHN